VPKTIRANSLDPRDELGEADQGRGQGELADRVRRSAHRDDASRLVALRTGPGRKILYDGERMSYQHCGCNQYLTREYRAGWAV